MRRGRRGDDDVGLARGGPGSASSEPTSPPKRCGQRARAVGVAVGDEDRPYALLGERARAVSSLVSPAPMTTTLRVARGRRRTLAGEVDRDRRDAHALAADPGLACARACRSAARREQAVGHRPGRAGGQRGLVGALDLALDLGLADDHRLQARGDAVELARGVAVARRVDRRRRARSGGSRRGCASMPEHVGLGARPGRRRRGRPRCGCRSRSPRPRAPRRRRGQLAQERSAPVLGRAPARSRTRDRRGLVRDAEREQLAHRRSRPARLAPAVGRVRSAAAARRRCSLSSVELALEARQLRSP